jgi:hypothetical protein
LELVILVGGTTVSAGSNVQLLLLKFPGGDFWVIILRVFLPVKGGLPMARFAQETLIVNTNRILLARKALLAALKLGMIWP